MREHGDRPINGHLAVNSSTTAGTPAQQAVMEAVQRVLASDLFHGANRLRMLLGRLVDRTLAGDLEGLKEYRLGVEVFERGQAFDPSTDSVVRTQATLLRKRLAQYYAGPGRSDPVWIELPRGGYACRFVPAPAPARPAKKKPAWLRPLAWVMLGFALGAGFALLPGGLRGRERGGFQEFPIWSTFSANFQRSTLALGTAYFLGLGNGQYFRDVLINDDAELAKRGLPELLRRTSVTRAFEYTGMGDALGLASLIRVFERSGWPLRTLRAEQLRWQDLKEENVIILGSCRFKGIDSEFDPYSEFAYDSSTPAGKILNLQPGPGEQHEYRSFRDGNRQVTYATISLLPGTVPGRRILILHGLLTWGTQAAAEFVATPEYLEQLRGRLAALARAGRAPEFIQVLIQVELRDDQPVGMSIVSVKELHKRQSTLSAY